MTAKTKLIFTSFIWGIRNKRARSLAKKITRYEDEDRYPQQFRNEYVLKKTKKFLKTLNIKLEVKGYDNLPSKPVIIAPNHSSSVDPAIILKSLENPGNTSDDVNPLSVFLGKEELKKQKRFIGYFNVLSTYFIDRKNARGALKVMDEMAEHSKMYKKHIVIFPEGTRSKDGKIQEFKSGAFRIAKKSFMPIVPVTINNAWSASDLRRKNKLVVEVIFHKPIKPMSFMTADNKNIAERVKKVVESGWVKPEGKRSTEEETF